jgi:hypothetical protein
MTQALDEVPSYAWPPLPILDPIEAAAVMAERLGAAYDDLETERQHVLLSATLGRKDLVDTFLSEFQAAILAFAARHDETVYEFLRKHIGPVYQQGATNATGQPMTWTTPHTAALTALATDTFGDFLKRSLEAQRVSAAFVRAIRAASALEIPKIAAGGRTARQAADRLEARLLKQGVDVVTYRDGSRVPVRTYVRMAARTKSAVAYNAGTLNGSVEVGVGWVEVFDGPECGWTFHDDEDKANRSIRSVADAGIHAIGHPNCRRAFGPRPDITSPEEAKTATPTQLAAVEDDQRESDRLRDLSAARVRAAAARRRRLEVKRAARRGATSMEDIIRASVTIVPGDD